MVNCINLNGSIRKDLGSANTNRLRKEGFIPAVIYGENGSENIFFSISKKDFNKEYLKKNVQLKIFEIEIEGKKYKVLPYQIDIDPVSDLPRHVDFLNIEGKKEVKVFIPVNYIGADKSPGVKKGGFLNVLKRKIRFFVDPMNIPNQLDIDVSKMHIGSKIKINDVVLGGLKPVDKSNFTVCSVTGRGKSDVAAPIASTTDTSANATKEADDKTAKADKK